ncbi:MAG: MBL fold metallo-hydrolase [Terriglobia bacterium]
MRKDRSEPSSLLIVDGRSYLIDCGIGTIRRLVRAGIRSETIGTIFITHHHPDHDLGLASVMANDFFNMDLAGAAHNINIYGPPQTEEFVKAAFSYISIPFGVFAAEGLGDTKLTSLFRAHDLQHDGLVYQDDKIRVIAAENSHYALIPEHFRSQMKSYSYRFETPHGVIVFTGDTGPSDAVKELAKGADGLVSQVSDFNAMSKFVHAMAARNHWPPQRLNSMMAHMKIEGMDREEVGELASKAQVKSVVLYHLAPEGVGAAAFVSGVKRYFSGPVFAGADLERYCLSKQADKGTSARMLSPCH